MAVALNSGGPVEVSLNGNGPMEVSLKGDDPMAVFLNGGGPVELSPTEVTLYPRRPPWRCPHRGGPVPSGSISTSRGGVGGPNGGVPVSIPLGLSPPRPGLVTVPVSPGVPRIEELLLALRHHLGVAVQPHPPAPAELGRDQPVRGHGGATGWGRTWGYGTGVTWWLCPCPQRCPAQLRGAQCHLLRAGQLQRQPPAAAPGGDMSPTPVPVPSPDPYPCPQPHPLSPTLSEILTPCPRPGSLSLSLAMSLVPNPCPRSLSPAMSLVPVPCPQPHPLSLSQSHVPCHQPCPCPQPHPSSHVPCHQPCPPA